jgi:cytosine/adenosine deaminase-related metal-dependent hydrolase
VKTVLRAKWVAPIDRPVITDGAVAFENGLILGADTWPALRRDLGDLAVQDLGDAVILPGLVNAHTHLELGECQCGDAPRGRFVDWLKWMIERGRSMTAEDAQRGAQVGIEQCLRFGVTCVGDITSWPGATRPILGASPLRGVSFGEVRGMGSRRGQIEELLNAAMDRGAETDRVRAGISPHSPYSLEAEGYRKCLAAARERGMLVATHLAESADEARFLADHAGELRELWDWLGAWDEGVTRFEGGPVRCAKSLGLLDYPTLLAHVNYCDDREIDLLAEGQASVVYCPRTHEYFGHPPHRWRQMLERGVNVVVGTDSCASSPDLNLVDDLRLLHRLAPQVPAEMLWEMGTIRGARALAMEGEVGSITAGKKADLVVFSTRSHNPLAEVLESQPMPASVWINGDCVH